MIFHFQLNYAVDNEEDNEEYKVIFKTFNAGIDGDGNAKQTDVLGQSLRDFKEYIAPKRSPMVKRKVIRRQVTQTGGEGDHAPSPFLRNYPDSVHT